MQTLQSDAVERFVALTLKGVAAAENDADGADQPISYQTDNTYERIRKCLERGPEDLPCAYLTALGRALEISANLKRDLNVSVVLFRRVRDAIRQVAYVAGLQEEGPWIEAIAMAQRQRRSSLTDNFDNPSINATSRTSIVGQAFKRLEQRGYDYGLQ